MAILYLDVWTNDGPSVTGKRPVRGTARNPVTGQTTPISSGDELRALIQKADDTFTIVVTELTDST